MTPETVAPAAAGVREWSGPKPRMVFFRINDLGLPEFVNGHFRDHVRCLEQFFDLVVVDENADYDEVVDRVHPDIALFESGVYARAGRRITNTHRHPEIPKIGFLDADGYCPTRSVFLADMDEWGVETFFALALSAAGYTPEIADRTYAWPNFADKAVFRSYADGKAQSILLSGSRESNYPWRVKVDRLLRQRFPVRALPHAGWFDRAATAGMPTGESYARTLSAAEIVPTCGTIAEDLVRKHLEIPAAGALLLTERTVAVESAGFVDMESCVFADDNDVVGKVAFLLDNPDVLQRITLAGQKLAHRRHSIENRDQLRQWYELRRTLQPGQRIVQRDPFAALVIEDALPERAAVTLVTPPGIDRRLMADGDRLLAEGQLAAAADRFAQVLNFHFEPEAGLGLARSWIGLGRPDGARRILEHSTALVLRGHGAAQPDPVEWAWLVRTALCEDDLARAVELAVQNSGLRHPELDRVRAVVGALSGEAMPHADRVRRLSVHAGAGGQAWDEWKADLARDLRVCGRTALSLRVRVVPDPTVTPPRPTRAPDHPARARTRPLVARARGRLRREWAKLRRQDSIPKRTSVFQLSGGRDLDVAVLVLVDESTAQQVEDLVSRDSSSIGLVRVGGRSRRAPEGGFVPWGWRSGVEETVLGSLPDWGASLVVAGRLGAGIMTLQHLAGAEIVIVVADGPSDAEAELERRIASDPAWRAGETALVDRASDALAPASVRVWERIAPSPVEATR